MADRICVISGCDRKVLARGWCGTHYSRWKRTGTTSDPTPRLTVCTIDGCDGAVWGRGWCQKHHMRWYRHGDPLHTELDGSPWPCSHGYWKLHRPGHPLADSRGQVYLHRFVLFDAIGLGPHRCRWCATTINWGSDLNADHVDANKANNMASNLVPSCTRCNVTRGRYGDDALERLLASERAKRTG